MTQWFVFNNKIYTFSAGKLFVAGLFGVEMIEACFTSKYLATLRDF